MNNLLFELSDVFFEGNKEEVFNIDQGKLLGDICLNKTAGIAYQNIKKTNIMWRKEFKQTLKTLYEINVEKNNKYMEILVYLSGILKDADFKYALLKGAVLSTKYYSKGMRISNDIDILIHKDDISRCQSLLFENGFIQGHFNSYGELIKASRREIVMSKMNYGETVPFVKIIDGYNCEIDINFSVDFKPEDSFSLVSKLLENRELIEVKDIKFYSLDMYNFFIHLCCHLYKEATTYDWVVINRDLQLYKFSDINLFIRCCLNTLNIDNMISRIIQFGVEKECYYALYNTGYIFPKVKNEENYRKLIKAIEPKNLDYMKQIIEPSKNRKYFYNECFEDWFSLNNRKDRLIEIK